MCVGSRLLAGLAVLAAAGGCRCLAADGAIAVSLERVLDANAEVCYGVAYNADGSRLAVTCRSKDRARWLKNTANEIQVWDLPTGKKTLVINRQAGRLQCVAFSPDGKHLASSAWKGVVIWDAVTGKRGVPLYLPAVNPGDSPMEDRPTTVPAPPAGHSMADEYDLSFAAGWVTYSRDGSVLAAAGPA